MPETLRRLLVDHEHSFGQRARERRQRLLLDTFPDLECYTVLDLGGRRSFWERMTVRPAFVLALNCVGGDEPTSWFDSRIGDACDPPEEIVASDFDLVFSNSTIEHVGGTERRRRFADVARSLAPRHWIQTPNRYFPLEPHWLAPGVQFLPPTGRALFSRYWPLVHTRSPDWELALAHARGTELIGRRELAALFPDSEIHDEQAFRMTKSLIAVHK